MPTAIQADPAPGVPTEWLRPDFLAFGRRTISAGIRARENTQAATTIQIGPTASMVEIAEIRKICEIIKASTPYVPIWLSFMISNRRSGVKPPQSPSNVSARPSSCIAPVIKTSTATSNEAATNGGSCRPIASQPVRHASPPTTSPTSGNAHADCACRANTALGKRGRGRRVNSTRASGTSHRENGLVSFFCTPVPFGVLLVSILRLNTQDHSDAMRLSCCLN